MQEHANVGLNMFSDGFNKGMHEYKHDYKLGFARLGFSENMLKTLVMFHASFEDFGSISRPKCLLESCSNLSLKTFGTDFSLIGAIKQEL